MDQRLLKLLDGETKYYPFSLENKFPRILAQILMLWDQPGMSDYFMELMVCDREDRSGFPLDVAAELMRLFLVHSKSRKDKSPTDVWEVSIDSLAKLKAAKPVDTSNQSKPSSALPSNPVGTSSNYDTGKGFHQAVQSSNLKAVDLFLKARVDIEIQDERGRSALMLAAFNGHDEVIRSLIEHKANLQTRDLLGNTALHWATEAGKTSSAKILLEKGAEVDARNHFGITPMYQATVNRSLEDVLLLLENGADPNIPINDGSTSLHKAAAEGYGEIVKVLLSHGADLSVKRFDGSLPLTVAAKNGQSAIIKLLTSAPRHIKQASG